MFVAACWCVDGHTSTAVGSWVNMQYTPKNMIMFRMLMSKRARHEENSTSTDRRSLWRPYDDAHVTLTFWNLEMKGDVIKIILNVIHFHAIHGGSLTASPHIQITSCDHLCTEESTVQVNSCSSKQTGNVHPYWTRQCIAPLAGRIDSATWWRHSLYISSRVFRRSTLTT